MTAMLAAARTIPTRECWGSDAPSRARTASKATNAARPKKENAIRRSAVFSRVSGSRPANCHATAAAERTSTIESNPNPIRALEDATVPALIATTASMML